MPSASNENGFQRETATVESSRKLIARTKIWGSTDATSRTEPMASSPSRPSPGSPRDRTLIYSATNQTIIAKRGHLDTKDSGPHSAVPEAQ